VARRRALVWTAPALDDLDEIAAHIALDDPRAAARLVRRVLQGVERLRRFPDSGRWVPEAPRKTYREVIVASCRIIYRREGRKRLIVHVARGERRVRVERLGQEAG
jgi:plasmid stabilization system protein ParE